MLIHESLLHLGDYIIWQDKQEVLEEQMSILTS